MTVSASYVRLDKVAVLAWVSHQIIVGTVVEELPPVWVYPDPQREPHRRTIFTDYLVRVEQRLRGLPGDTVLVRLVGGTLDGCTQQAYDVPVLAVGDRWLFFLHEFNLPSDPPLTYSPIAGPQGYWTFNADGTVSTAVPHYQQFDRAPLNQVAEAVRTALLGAPPATTPRDLLVPLDRAPLPTAP